MPFRATSLHAGPCTLGTVTRLCVVLDSVLPAGLRRPALAQGLTSRCALAQAFNEIHGLMASIALNRNRHGTSARRSRCCHPAARDGLIMTFRVPAHRLNLLYGIKKHLSRAKPQESDPAPGCSRTTPFWNSLFVVLVRASLHKSTN